MAKTKAAQRNIVRTMEVKIILIRINLIFEILKIFGVRKSIS